MTKTLRISSLLLAAACLSATAYASDSQSSSNSKSTMKIEEATGQTNKVKNGEDADKVITNRLMRAEAGSKSKYSISTSFAYNGGTIERPLAARRPNIRAATNTPSYASLGGNIAVKDSLTSTDSLLAGTGVTWYTPLQGGQQHPKSFQTFNVQNPYINYQKIYRIGALQSQFVAGPMLFTDTAQRQIGSVLNLAVSQNSVYEFGKTGFSLGVLVGADGYTYDKNSPDMKAQQADYDFGIYPFAEYVLNDTFNLRTIVGLWNYEHIRSEGRPLSFVKDRIYQSVGLGISLTRDVYLYPNIQFLPEHIRADETNVALSTYINIF